MRVYLDVCCLSRLTDDHSQARIREEAEAADADVMLTTDDRLLKRIARNLGNPRIPVRNPLSWLKEQGL